MFTSEGEAAGAQVKVSLVFLAIYIELAKLPVDTPHKTWLLLDVDVVAAPNTVPSVWLYQLLKLVPVMLATSAERVAVEPSVRM